MLCSYNYCSADTANQEIVNVVKTRLELVVGHFVHLGCEHGSTRGIVRRSMTRCTVATNVGRIVYCDEAAPPFAAVMKMILLVVASFMTFITDTVCFDRIALLIPLIVQRFTHTQS